MENKFVIGIDIGGTNTKFGIVDSMGKIIEQGTLKTGDYEEAYAFLKAVKKSLDPMIERVGGVQNLKGIGMGCPNGNPLTGLVEYAANLKWKGIVPLKKMAEEIFMLPAALNNDAKAAAIGEMKYGAARGMKDFITITLGTGVGSGIVANGKLILGHDGFAGELGHTTIIPGGRLHPGTGLRGSLESYASATGMVTTAIEFLKPHPQPPSEGEGSRILSNAALHSNEISLLSYFSPDEINSKIIYECAIKGDKIAKEIFEYTGKILGEALANFVMFSSPEAIILFGGLTKAGDLLLNPVKENMEKNLLPVFKGKVKLLFSELKDADAGILGASAMVWDS